MNWSGSKRYDKGNKPSVALNNQGLVVEVHKSEANSGLWYHVGRVNGSSINWGASVKYDNGVSPSVALTDDGMVIEIHQSQNAGTLWQRIGRVNGNNIDWAGGAVNFDNGAAPSVACGGKLSIQTHQSEIFTTLWFSTAVITDHSSWMQNNFNALKNKTLKQLTLPASHDSGMYPGGVPESLGKTQDLSIYEQLSYGIRYFDLRPGWDGDDFYIYHDVIKGPRFSDVLSDVRRFMAEGHRELVILKLSHYKDLNNDLYKNMVQRIKSNIDGWLFNTLPAGKRLAEIPLSGYISNAGAVLVVCDENYPVNNPSSGIWVYRDWQTNDAARGDLRVYDQYANTTSYDAMKKDQLDKFRAYNGRCLKNQNLPCDLFLLSWTLTPPTGVWAVSKDANRNLGEVLARLNVPNSFGCVPNLLYVDYVEYARVTDVALYQNGIRP